MVRAAFLTAIFCIAAGLCNSLFSQWQQTTAPYEYVHALTANNEVVLASIGSGFFKSIDHGNSWSPSGNGITQLPINQIISLSGSSTFYASSSDNIYKSTDNGENWSLLTGVAQLSYIRHIYFYNGYLFAATGIDDPNYGLNRSSDEGLTWQHLSTGLTSQGIGSLNNDDTYLYAGLTGTGPGSSPGVFRSTDNGDNWEFASYGFETDIYGMATLGGRIYALFYAVIKYSENHGNSWESTLGLYPSFPVTEIEPVGNYLIACQITGPSKLHKDSIVWESWYSNPISMNCLEVTCDQENVYIGTSDLGIWRRPVDQLVGIEESEVLNSGKWISVSPNPADASAEIMVNAPADGSLLFRIYDSQGRMVGNPAYKIVNGENRFPLDLTGLKPGIYHYLAIKDNIHASGRLVIICR